MCNVLHGSVATSMFFRHVSMFFLCRIVRSEGGFGPAPIHCKQGSGLLGEFRWLPPKIAADWQGSLPEGLVPSTVGSDITFSLLRAGFYPPAACALAWLEANLQKKKCLMDADLLD